MSTPPAVNANVVTAQKHNRTVDQTPTTASFGQKTVNFDHCFVGKCSSDTAFHVNLHPELFSGGRCAEPSN
jgi:hypothetical protein